MFFMYRKTKSKRDGKGERENKTLNIYAFKTLREAGYHLSWPTLPEWEDWWCVSVWTHPVGTAVTLPGHGCQLGVQEISGLVDTLRGREYKSR